MSKKTVKIGDITIGNNNKIAVQSMTNTLTSDARATAEQINRLAAAGCDIVRFAVPDMAAAEAVKYIKENTDIPLVADIHFDYRRAQMYGKRDRQDKDQSREHRRRG